jgi:hypothetical protein
MPENIAKVYRLRQNTSTREAIDKRKATTDFGGKLYASHDITTSGGLRRFNKTEVLSHRGNSQKQGCKNSLHKISFVSSQKGLTLALKATHCLAHKFFVSSAVLIVRNNHGGTTSLVLK